RTDTRHTPAPGSDNASANSSAPDRWAGVRAGVHAAIAAPARPRATLRDDSRVTQLNLRIVNAPQAPVIRTTYSAAHNTLLRGPIESGQYVSLAFGRAAGQAGIAVSMGSRGDAYDNAVAETFFATLKKELVNRRSWPSRLELQSAVFHYIEAFYNRQRRHSTLGMLSPIAYEQLRPSPLGG
ncbi:MAG: IS3 family transposase, partial [Solirubrobacteraceae bacterium]